MTTTERPQFVTHVTLPASRRRVFRRCVHCGRWDTTVHGALWRTGQGDHGDHDDHLYYLHSACLSAYKTAHGLRSVEGRIPLTAGRDALPEGGVDATE